MKKRSKLQSTALSVLLVTLCVLLTLSAAALRVGDVVGYVLSTDIRAYIDGVEIPAYNIDGHLGVVAEDLRGYGFLVDWNAEKFTLSISLAPDAPLSPAESPARSDQPVGTRILPVLHTSVVTDIDGKVVESFNIDGRTIIYFKDLAVYGACVYEHDAHRSTLTVRSVPPLRHSLPRKIIHAGGAIGNMVGSNSLEALNATYARGYRFIEMDFRFSSDGKPICLHDWSKLYSAQLSPRPMTAAAFASVRIFNRYTSVTLDSLAKWLVEHPDAYIITDCKEDNLTLLRRIATDHPALLSQFIPQIYQYSEAAPVRELGYKNIILTLYRLPTYPQKADGAANAAFAKQHGLLAVTADVSLVTPEYVRAFSEAGIPLFVHTVNNKEEQTALYAMGVSCIYTDYAN